MNAGFSNFFRLCLKNIRHKGIILLLAGYHSSELGQTDESKEGRKGIQEN